MLPYALVVVFRLTYLWRSDWELWLILSLLGLNVCFLVSHVVVLVISGSWVLNLIWIVLWYLVSHTRITLVTSDGPFRSCLLIRYTILYLMQLVLLMLRVTLINRKTWRRYYCRWIINFSIDVCANIWLTCNNFTMFFMYDWRGVCWRK